VQLHKAGFALHAELAAELGVTSYRKLPVLRVSPGKRRQPVSARSRPRPRQRLETPRAETDHACRDRSRDARVTRALATLAPGRPRAQAARGGGGRGATIDICPWLDGEVADSDYMDKLGGAQVRAGESRGRVRATSRESVLESRGSRAFDAHADDTQLGP
jgi:hypothetical protein